jgi:hypothetical protein
MAPPTTEYEKVPRADADLDAPVSDYSESDDEAEYTGRTKRRSFAESERGGYDRETLGGHEEVERLLAVDGTERSRNKRARRGELGRLEQGGKSESSSVSGGDESPARAMQEKKRPVSRSYSTESLSPMLDQPC